MAEEFIRRYLMHADDPKVRGAAKKTLEDAGLDPDKRPLAANKPQDDGDTPPDEPKTPPAEGKKGGDKDTQPPPKETPKDEKKQGESKGDGQTPKQPPTPPATAKDRQDGGDWNPGAAHRPNDPEKPAKEAPLAQPKGLLQLYNFWQRVPKDVLKDVLADSDQRKVLENAATDGKDDLGGVQHGGPLNSTAGKRSNPNGQSATDDPDNGGRARCRRPATASRTRSSPNCCRPAATNKNFTTESQRTQRKTNAFFSVFSVTLW